MPHDVLSTIAWYVGRVKILTGVAVLGTATVVLALSGGRRTTNWKSKASLGLIPLILAVLSLLFFTDWERTHKSRA